MKHSIIILSFLVAVCVPGVCFAAPEIPSGLSLTSTETTITVTWTANDDEATGYKVYWGESSGNLNNTITIDDDDTTTTTISNLQANSTYYAAISAYDADSESSRSSVLSVATKSSAPDTPENLDITSPSEISDSVIPLKWDHNSEDDMSHYLVSYRTPSISYNAVETGYVNTYSLSGLTGSTRYYIKIAAVDTAGNTSSYTTELIADTTPDSNRPFTPQSIESEITGEEKIRISFSANNNTMADFKGCRVYYRTADKDFDISRSLDAENETSATFSLSENVTYYFTVTAYDYFGNESFESTEVSAMIEPTRTLLSETGSFGGGCFVDAAGERGTSGNAGAIMIAALACAGMFILVFRRIRSHAAIGIFLALFLCSNAFCQDDAETKDFSNLIGAKLGYFEPMDSNQDDIYDDNPWPFHIFYERHMFLGLSAEAELGYSRREGHAITGDGQATGIATKLTLIPFSTTLKWNFEISPLVHVFVGGGLDYWYYLEETDTAEYDAADDDYGVGGYHLKAGGKFWTGNEKYYKKYGVLLETVYSRIDRFGGNETDLGGWHFNIGGFYSF